MYMLDTNVCIHLLNGSAPRVKGYLRDAGAQNVCVSVVTALELAFGARKSRRKKTRETVDAFLGEMPVGLLDTSALPAYAETRAALERRGKPIGPLDTLIAAHCLTLDAILVTNNTKEFRRVPGLTVEDWTE